MNDQNMSQKVIIIKNEHIVFRCCICVDCIANDRLRVLRKIFGLKTKKAIGDWR